LKKNKNIHYKYIVANNTDEQWGMVVTTIGVQSTPPNRQYPSKDHPPGYWFSPEFGRVLHEYQLIYATKGTGIFQSSTAGKIQISAGNVIILFPEEWHTYQPESNKGWEAYWIGFRGPNMDLLLRNSFYSRAQPVLDIGFNENIIGLFQQGIDIANYQKSAFQAMLAGIVQLLLGSVYYIHKNNSLKGQEIGINIEQARIMIRENIFSGGVKHCMKLRAN